jgi:2-polyprenyl-3-methyl-5-hydroxy-6-metoxy-1,4-benzoquinol methylase
MGDIAHFSENDHIIWKCHECSVQWLADNNCSDEYYWSDEYRKEIGQKCDLQDYRSRHDEEVDYQLDIVPVGTYRDKVVADIGCGGGSFLDAIRGFARQTIAVERISDD